MHSFFEGIGIRNEVCLCGICHHMGNERAQQWESHAVHRHKALGLGCWHAFLEAELPFSE